MKNIKIYCENGALDKEIKALKENSDIQLIYFPFENWTRKAYRSNNPSELTCDNTSVTACDDRIRISNTNGSEIFDSIKKIIGSNNLADIKHVDTAYKEKCQIFITSDKDDIMRNSDELEKLTGIRFFYHHDYELVYKEIRRIRDI